MKRAFHGLVVELREPAAHQHGLGHEHLHDQPLAAFFSHFPEAEASSPADLLLVTERRAALPRPDVVKPLFFHGVVQVSRASSGYVAQAPGLVGTLSADARALCLVREDQIDPPYAAGLLHVLLLFALRFHGLFDLHAGAAVVGDSVALVLGDSGAGKTTTALALAAGGHLLGDDRLLLRPGDPRTLLAYPRALHLGDTTRAMFPAMRARAVPGEAKHEAHFPGGSMRVVSGRASRILLPRITDAPLTTVTAASDADVFGQLLSASALALVEGVPGRDAQLGALRSLSDLPAHHLALGRDAAGDPDVIRRLLSGIVAEGAP